MKKVLLTTTVLALSASVAAADGVSLKGMARVGIDNAGGETTLKSRIQVDASGGITTDSGLTLGAKSRLRVENSAAGDDGGFNNPEVTIGLGGVHLAFGNTNSAMAAAGNPFGTCVGEPGDYCMGDFKGIYSSNSKGPVQKIRADVSMGGATVSLSSDMGSDAAELGVKTSVGAFNVGVGMGFGGASEDQYVADVNGSFGDIKVGFRATDVMNAAYLTYTSGALGVQAYASDQDAQAVGVTYDLGGATLGLASEVDGASEITLGFAF
jgi:outer membrane protein OmpU